MKTKLKQQLPFLLMLQSRKQKEHEFYPTPAYITEELLKREKFSGIVLEPCCGNGAISKVLKKQGFKTISSDLVFRGYGTGNMDFLSLKSATCDNVITNPPYTLGLEFVLKAKTIAKSKIAMFLPTTFLTSQKRKEMFKDKDFRLKTIYQFSKRPSLYINGDDEGMNGGKIDYCWFVWSKKYNGKPYIAWI